MFHSFLSQIIHSAAQLFVWIERHDHSVHMSSVLRVQQLYTAGIPLLEAYLLPMANTQIRKERLSNSKWPLATWSRFIRMRVFHEVKMADLSCSRTNRKRSSFATKHFQRKLLKIFDLHPPQRRLVSFVARIIA